MDLSLTTQFSALGGTALAFFLFDVIWLGLIGNRLYRAQLEPLLRDRPRAGHVLLFYGLYVSGLTILCVLPALDRQSVTAAITQGTILGLVAYGTYDLTNGATLRGWPARVTLIHMVWGVLLSAMAAYSGYLAGNLTR